MRSGVLKVRSSSRDSDGTDSGTTCQACQALNKLYEADHPAFESRMEGKCNLISSTAAVLVDAGKPAHHPAILQASLTL
jgi:hypothetical protein